MLFHDPDFLFYFLPFSLLFHRLALGFGKRAGYNNFARLAIFALTIFFYGCKEPWWLLPFFCCIGFDFLWASLLARAGGPRVRKALLFASVFQNLSLLGVFKYWDAVQWRLVHLFPSLAPHLPTLGLPLPPGISFYTFESLSFVIDIYRRDILPPKNPLVFFGFIGMFPRFIAGPIVRYKQMISQFDEYRGMEVQAGLFLFVYGLFLKLCLADSFSVFTKYAFGYKSGLGVLSAWTGVFAYTMQIYFDFSGYSLMAIGLGRCFGFQFPTNFNRPYLSSSIQEFWRRWHISLSTWLKDYLYVSLGGSKKGTFRTYRNLFLTMVIGGIWHGAGVTYLLWGMWHGGLLCLERALGFPASRLRPWMARGITFGLTMIGWVFFNAKSPTEAVGIFKAMFFLSPHAAAFNSEWLFTNPIALVLCAAGIAHCFVLEPRLDAGELERIQIVGAGTQVAAVGMFVLSLVLGLSQFIVPFLYFQF